MKKYQVIYADPPWRYSFSQSNCRKVENQYFTMELADIKNLPVKEMSEKNSVLYLWATAPKLLESLEVMEAWGFEYKSHSVWDKEIIGMGYWWRGRHELLLVGIKGKFSPPNPDKRDPSVYREKRSKHSKKPDYFRDKISQYYPNLSKIELFSRKRVEGWDCWGNEVESDIVIEK